jgi:phage terminase small subunit
MAHTSLALSGDCKGLNDRQRMFVSEYLVHFDAVKASLTVGYKNPNKTAERLLKNRKIIRAIGNQQRKTIEKHMITRDEIVSELSNIALRDLIELCDKDGNIQCDLREIPARARRWIDSIDVDQTLSKSGKIIGQKIKLKLVPKMQAIEYLMKHFSMFAPDKAEVKHSIDWDGMYEQKPDGLDAIEGEISKIEEDKRD